MTSKLYIIHIQLLAKTIEDIPPRYLFNDCVAVWFRRYFRLEKIVLQANRTLKFQVLRSNPLLADFKLQWLSVTLNDRTTCGIIWNTWIRSTKPIANDGHYFFAAVNEYKEITDLQTLGWPIQINLTFWNILNILQFLSTWPARTVMPTCWVILDCWERFNLLKNMDWKVSRVAIYLQILFHFSQWWSNISS